MRQHIPGGLQVAGAEHDPAEADDVERHDDADDPPPARHVGTLRLEARHMGHEPFVHRERGAVPAAPQHEAPCRAVPQAAQQHRDDQVQVGPQVSFAVAAQ